MKKIKILYQTFIQKKKISWLFFILFTAVHHESINVVEKKRFLKETSW